jgi:hypothetical protein
VVAISEIKALLKSQLLCRFVRELSNGIEVAKAYASASAGSTGNSVCLPPPIHRLTESIRIITAAIMISAVKEVLM